MEEYVIIIIKVYLTKLFHPASLEWQSQMIFWSRAVYWEEGRWSTCPGWLPWTPGHLRQWGLQSTAHLQYHPQSPDRRVMLLFVLLHVLWISYFGWLKFEAYVVQLPPCVPHPQHQVDSSLVFRNVFLILSSLLKNCILMRN